MLSPLIYRHKPSKIRLHERSVKKQSALERGVQLCNPLKVLPLFSSLHLKQYRDEGFPLKVNGLSLPPEAEQCGQEIHPDLEHPREAIRLPSCSGCAVPTILHQRSVDKLDMSPDPGAANPNPHIMQ